jgi:phosphatidylinositol alpha-mannosyltransferase
VRIGLVSAYALDVPGGVQDQVLGLARHLAGAGHEARVLAPGPAVAGSVSAGPAVAVPGNGSVASLALVPARERVRRWAAGLDVVHLHEPLAPGLPQAVLRAAAGGGPAVVATVHARSDSGLLAVAAPLLRRRLRAATCVTAVSRHAAATLTRIGVAADETVPNAVDVPAAVPDTAWPVRRAGPRTVVAVGRLAEPRKGIDVLLAAWPDVRRLTDAELVLVGPGRPRGGRRLPDGVHLAGRVPDAERDALVGAADLVVAPHRGGESFGLVVAEAMARGRPVVASDLPAFADLLASGPGGGAAGLLVPPGRPGPLGEAMVQVLTDPGLRVRLGSEGRARASGLAWQVVVPRWLGIYRRAVTTPMS